MVRASSSNRRAVSGGVYVVLITGLVAALRFGQVAHGPADYLLLGAIVVGTLVGATLLHRFIAKHRNDIGEASFRTDGS